MFDTAHSHIHTARGGSVETGEDPWYSEFNKDENNSLWKITEMKI